MLGLKQTSRHEDWLPVLAAAYAHPDHDRADALVARAAARVRAVLDHYRPDSPGYGWSGGKDSQALRVVMDEAGVTDAYLAISNLEWPAFLAWATEHMPFRLHVVLRRHLDLAWLREHPAMLFPDHVHAAKWFQAVQGAGRRAYARSHDVIFLGRRAIDGNWTGRRAGDWLYRTDGTLVASPIADWSHEDVLTVLGAHAMPLPPNYSWPRGFRVGTGAWPARQWTAGRGWAEVRAIDPSVVEHAARAGIPGAEEALG